MEISQSPTPIKVVDAEIVPPSESNLEKDAEVDFPTAMKYVIEGKKITRKEWDDDKAYGELKDGFLMINNKGMHQWLVSDGDLTAEDWLIIE